MWLHMHPPNVSHRPAHEHRSHATGRTPAPAIFTNPTPGCTAPAPVTHRRAVCPAVGHSVAGDTAAAPLSGSSECVPFPLDSPIKVLEYLATQPHLLSSLGAAGTPAALGPGPAPPATASPSGNSPETPPAPSLDPGSLVRVEELTEGKINYVYRLTGPAGAALLLKYAAPYVRSIGPSFQLTQARMRVEAASLELLNGWCPQHTARLVAYDHSACVLVQEHLPPPHAKLLTGLGQGGVFPLLPAHLSALLPAYLFQSSRYALPVGQMEQRAQQFANEDIVRANAAVVLENPWDAGCSSNRHTAGLDTAVAALRADTQAAQRVRALRRHYLATKEALIHNDLHVGNLLVTLNSTYLIDWEFATYGPWAYDVGSILGNLFMAYFASYGLLDSSTNSIVSSSSSTGNPSSRSHGSSASLGDQQRAWLLATIDHIWEGVCRGLLEQQQRQQQLLQGSGGHLQRPCSVLDAQVLEQLEGDSLAYCACVMVRLTIGMHRYPGFEAIPDSKRRARCEGACLNLARVLLTCGGNHNRGQVASVGSALRWAKAVAKGLE